MPNVLNEFAGDGVTQTFNFSMTGGYLSRDYVYFFTRPNDDLLNYTPYNDDDVTWLTDFSVRIANPIPVGTTFVILRSTTLDPIVDFQNTSRITEKNLDTATRQSIHIAAETSDGMGRVTAVTGAALENSKEAVRIAEDAQSDAAAAKADAAEAKAGAAAALDVANEALELVESAVDGGVVSFNGRTGGVIPQAGDYTKDMIGLGRVDNTPDTEKPVSAAVAAALSDKAPYNHGHAIGDIGGLQEALASKADAQATATAIAGKAPAVHAHGMSDIQGLVPLAQRVDSLYRTRGKSKFFSSAMFGQKGITTILLQGDSTGNEDTEFFFLVMQRLVATFSKHMVVYRQWDHASQTWGNRVLNAGTNGKAIYAYNGSVSGANSTYWKGARRKSDLAYDGWQFDMIVCNYGLNNASADMLAAANSYIYDLRVNQPTAEIIAIIQPPDYNSVDYDGITRSTLRHEAQRRVYAEYGVGIVDMFSVFSDLVNKSNVESWYFDRIHPNLAGSRVWADYVYDAIENTVCRQNPIPTGPSIVPSGMMKRFPNGLDAAALWWDAPAGAVCDTVSLPNRAGMRAYGASGTGVTYTDISEFLRSVGPSDVTAVFNIATSGSSGLAGTPFISRTRGGAYQEWLGVGQGYLGESAGGQHWVTVTVPASVIADARVGDVFRLGLYTGTVGEWATVFSVNIGTGLVPPLPTAEGFKSIIQWDWPALTVPANGVNIMTLSGTGRPYVRSGAIMTACLRVPSGFVSYQTQHEGDSASVMVTNHSSTTNTVPAQSVKLTIE